MMKVQSPSCTCNCPPTNFESTDTKGRHDELPQPHLLPNPHAATAASWHGGMLWISASSTHTLPPSHRLVQSHEHWLCSSTECWVVCLWAFCEHMNPSQWKQATLSDGTFFATTTTQLSLDAKSSSELVCVQLRSSVIVASISSITSVCTTPAS